MNSLDKLALVKLRALLNEHSYFDENDAQFVELTKQLHELMKFTNLEAVESIFLTALVETATEMVLMSIDRAEQAGVLPPGFTDRHLAVTWLIDSQTCPDCDEAHTHAVSKSSGAVWDSLERRRFAFKVLLQKIRGNERVTPSH